MAEPKSRVVVVGKLLLLVGLPLSALGGVFGVGVHYGHAYRADILKLERDLLGMDVEVPVEGDGKLAAVLDEAAKALPDGSDSTAPVGPATGAPAAPTGAAAQPGPTKPQAQPGATAPTGAAVATPPAVTPPPTAATGPSGAPPPTTAPSPGGADVVPATAPSVGTVYPLATAPDIPDDLRASYDRTRVLRVKVLVDRAFIEQNEQWLTEVDGLLGAVSRNYGELFGMQFQLWGVVEWDVARSGLDIEQLHADLKTRTREGADLMVAITGRPMDSSRRNGWSETPDKGTPHNTAFAVVHADARRPDRLLRAVMHEVGHCFGARDVTEPSSDAWRRGSIMSYANVPSEAAPWFDAENLRRILERKHNQIQTEASLGGAPGTEHEN